MERRALARDEGDAREHPLDRLLARERRPTLHLTAIIIVVVVILTVRIVVVVILGVVRNEQCLLRIISSDSFYFFFFFPLCANREVWW